jgi:hypothetical protein
LERRLRESEQATCSDTFYKNIGAVATLGSSISFALIVTDIADPKGISQHGKFDLSAVRIMLAISWLLFMVALNFSFGYAQTMPSQEPEIRVAASKILYFLDILAVIFLSLVVSAYVEVVGYVGIGLASFVAVLLLIDKRGFTAEQPKEPISGGAAWEAKEARDSAEPKCQDQPQRHCMFKWWKGSKELCTKQAINDMA